MEMELIGFDWNTIIVLENIRLQPLRVNQNLNV